MVAGISKRPFTLSLIVCFLFSVPVLLLCATQSIRDGMATRTLVNNGERSTLFLVQAAPFSVFPEAAHLYIVRGKRIADRGFAGDLLWSRGDEAKQAMAAVPFQAGLGYIAYLTGGEPIAYGLFLFALTLVFMTLAAWFIQSQLANEFGAVELVSATILVFVLQDAISFRDLVSGFSSEIWPPQKFMRFPTFTWSLPLLISLYAASARLLVDGSLGRRAAIIVSAVLMLFALGDPWAFLTGLGVTGLAIAGAAWGDRVLLISAIRNPARDARSLLRRDYTIVAMGMVSALLVYQIIPHGSADGMVRSGFGGAWANDRHWRAIFEPRLIATAMLFAAAMAFTLFFCRGRSALIASAVAGLPVAACLILGMVLTVAGADSYQLTQFPERTQSGLLLGFLLLGLTWGKKFLPRTPDDSEKPRRGMAKLAKACLVLLALFWVADVARTAVFVRKIAAPDYALTRDLEGLQPTLVRLCEEHPRAPLITLSHEINYLAAIWTDCDLVLPEGFPLHSTSPDTVIASRAAAVFRFFGAKPADWDIGKFDQHPLDRKSWRQSRLLSEQQGTLYSLFHREGAHQRGSLRFAGPRLLDQLMKAGDDISIATLSPDIIVVSPETRQFDGPDLDGYSLAHRSGELEVWITRAWDKGS